MPGDVVLVGGLQSAKSLYFNSQHGVVVTAAKGMPPRHGVELADENGRLAQKALQPSNLTLVQRPKIRIPTVPSSDNLKKYR